MASLVKQFMDRTLSGRFLLTIACAIAFVYSVKTNKLSAEAITTIITMVFVSYFNRNDREKPKEGELPK